MLDFVKKNFESILFSLSQTSSIIDDNFENFVKNLNKTQGKIIFCSIGKSFWISNKISSTISSLGKPSISIHAAESTHGDLGIISSNDSVIFISNSGESKELFGALKFCSQNNIATFSITSSKKSTISSGCMYNIIIPDFVECLHPLNPPITSSIITLTIGDLIALSLAKLNNFSSKLYSKLHPNGKIGLLITNVEDYLKEQYLIGRKSNSNIKVSSKSSLKETIHLLESYNFGIIVIVDDQNKVKGCFTDGDLKRLINHNIQNNIAINFDLNIFDDSFSKFVNQNPRVINKNLSIFDVVETIKYKTISHSIIVDNDNLFCDIMDSRDFLKLL